MDNPRLPVENLKKITLSLEAGSSADTSDLTRSAVTVDFIFGIGANGLTPFEYELAGKQPGDAVTTFVQRENAPVFFEHLAFPILGNISGTDPFYLKALVVDVKTPEQREIIRAMAERTVCGSGCDCGCGCGI